MGTAKKQDKVRRDSTPDQRTAFVALLTLTGTLAYNLGIGLRAVAGGMPVTWSNFAALVSYTWVGTVAINVVVTLVAWVTFRYLDGRRLRALTLVLLWPWAVAYRVRHSACLAEWLVARAVACLPSPYRAQYEAVWLGEIDWQRQQAHPLIGWAIGVAGTAVFTRLQLRARLASAAGRLRELPKSRLARTVRQVKPIWLGVLTAVSVFCTAAVGWSGVGQQGPSRAQLLWAISASVVAGGGMTWQTWPCGPVANEPTDADGRLDE